MQNLVEKVGYCSKNKNINKLRYVLQNPFKFIWSYLLAYQKS